MRNVVISAGVLVGLTMAGGALAQEAEGQANVGMSLPGAQPAAAVAGASDHDQVVGRLAVGYFGFSDVGAGAGGGLGPNDSPYSLGGDAPVVGVRYWIDQMIGLDVGVGLTVIGGSLEAEQAPAPAVDVDRNSFTAFAFHAGVPLALASSGHFSFQIVPEANVAIASGSEDPNGDDVAGDISHSGFHFDVGARAGAEIHFGFIDIPQLSLQASVGLRFDIDRGSSEDSTPQADMPPAENIETSSSRNEFHTTVQDNPWGIFTNSVYALYYF